MKRILLTMLFVASIALIGYSATSPSADTKSTFYNGYAWGGHENKDDARDWAQAIEDNVDTLQTQTVVAGIQDIAAGGATTAVTLTNGVITVGADAGGDIVTIANGTAGQVLYLICEDATGTTTITPATFNGGTSITFDALGDAVTIVYTAGTGWSIVGGNSYTII